MYDLSVYDDKFYDDFGWEANEMARWFLPLLQSVVPFRSFADVGCGEGHYLRFLSDNGIHGTNLLGIEGSPAACRRWQGLGFEVERHDLRLPFHKNLYGKFDVVMSLEVAEHVEAEFAEVFVATLTLLSDTVVMTAAPPNQGGEHHVNEQPKSYWEDLLARKSYYRDAATEVTLLKGVASARYGGGYVTPWLEPNLMVYRRVI